jgi:hypothetical protein
MRYQKSKEPNPGSLRGVKIMSKNHLDAEIQDLRDLRSKWADQRRAQFGLTLALLTALSGAGLSFCGTLLKGAQPLGGKPGYLFLYEIPCQETTFWFLSASLTFATALLLGVFATVTRLLDFKLTASLPNKRLKRAKGENIGFLSIGATKCWTRALGKTTWGLCILQLTLLVIAIVTLAMALLNMYHSKLFPVPQ